MTTTRTTTATTVHSDEGFNGDETEGALILSVDGVEVRESTWAGAYYCAHVLYVVTRIARASQTSIARDAEGDPLVGFIHVPADAETGGGVGRARAERHARTKHIVACALAGVLDEVRANHRLPRVLLSGFGPFAAVVSNPTGDFVEHDESVTAALASVTGAPVTALEDVVADDESARIRRLASDDVVLGRIRLSVHDGALDVTLPGSLPWAIERFAPHAVIALGVHRASSIYRVELEPTNAGLAIVDGVPCHDRGRPIDSRDAHNRALARAIAKGAAKLTTTP